MLTESSSSSRKLAAILFADIAGYTSMMQSDEGKTMHKLRHYQTILKSTVGEYSGEIIKNYGDGSLCLFSSVLDAVQCAKALQETFRLEPVIPLRIGLHLGDVMYEENDIYGNDLNIASRIESMGITGAVLMSKNVHDKVKNQADLKFTSIGTFEFKNVEEPMEIFALANEGFSIPKRGEISGKFKLKEALKPKSGLQTWWPLIAFLFIASGTFFVFNQTNTTSADQETLNPKSIAVLPFTDLSPEQDQEYFSIGMMDEVLNHLVKIADLQVSSRTSSMQYQNTTTPIVDISKKLGVANVLEGSVRRAGNQVRITVQLIDGATDKHLWSETYDRKFEDIFRIQSDVAQSIASVLEAKIYPDVKERIERAPTQNMRAYDLWLRASNNGPTDRSQELLLEAIEIDSNFSLAYASLANFWLNKGGFSGDDSRTQIIPKVSYYIDKALEKDENTADAHRQNAQFALWYHWDFEKAEKEWKTYFKLNPSVINSNIIDFYSSSGRFEEAKEWAERINLISHNEMMGWSRRGLPYSLSGDYITSDLYYDQTLAQFPYWYAMGEAARGYTYSGQYEKVIDVINTSIEENSYSRYPRNLGLLAIAYHKTDQAIKSKAVFQDLLLACESGSTGSPSFYTAMVYAQMGEIEKAFESLEKSYQDHEVEMYWLMVEPPFQPLHDDLRWRRLLDKVGFDVPVKG